MEWPCLATDSATGQSPGPHYHIPLLTCAPTFGKIREWVWCLCGEITMHSCYAHMQVIHSFQHRVYILTLCPAPVKIMRQVAIGLQALRASKLICSSQDL